MTVWPLAAAAFAALTIAAYAQDKAPQVERWELMDAIGKEVKTMGGMAKREIPYDAATVENGLDVVIANGTKFPTLFPEGSETGHDTRALPAIWDNKADFDAKAAAMVEAAEAAKAAAPNGLEAFTAEFRNLGQSCRACHTDYRAEKT